MNRVICLISLNQLLSTRVADSAQLPVRIRDSWTSSSTLQGVCSRQLSHGSFNRSLYLLTGSITATAQWTLTHVIICFPSKDLI